jgi:hypothetical protein
MALNTVSLPFGYYPDPTKGRPVFNGSIFIGEPDLDPTILANQKTITIRQEGVDTPSVPQPISTSAGGVPVFNGSPAEILVDGSYSMAVLNNQDSQVYYVASQNDAESFSDTDLRYSPVFSTVAAMVAANPVSVDGIVVTLVAGMTVTTQGYTASGDGGNAKYLIVASQAADELGDHTNANGTVSVLQTNRKVTIHPFTTTEAGLTAALATTANIVDLDDQEITLTGLFTPAVTNKEIRNGVFTGNIAALFELAGTNGLKFQDVDFISTFTAASEDVFGLIKLVGSATGIKFIRCKFSSPNAKQNIFKAVVQGTDRLDGLEFIDCELTDAERMGIELQAHDADLSVTSIATAAGVATVTTSTSHAWVTGDRVQIKDAVEAEFNGNHIITVTGATTFTYLIATTAAASATGTILTNVFTIRDVRINDNKLQDLIGTLNNHAISLSGLVYDYEILSNRFRDIGSDASTLAQCIEIVGANDGQILNNRFSGYIGLPIGFGSGGPGSPRMAYNNVVSGNICADYARHNMQFGPSMINSIVSMNGYLGDDITANSTVIWGAVDSKLTHNILRSRGGKALNIKSDGCQITDNFLDTREAGTGGVLEQILLEDATGNRITGNIMQGVSGVTIRKSGTNVDNLLYDNPTFKDVNNLGSITFATGTVATGARFESAGLTVSDAAIGDQIIISPPSNTSGMTYEGLIVTNGEVRIVVTNNTGSNQSIASAKWRVRVVKNEDDN